MKSVLVIVVSLLLLSGYQCFVIPPGGQPIVPQQYHHYVRPVVYQFSYYYNIYPQVEAETKKSPELLEETQTITPTVTEPQPAQEEGESPAIHNPSSFALLDAPVVCPPGQAPDRRGRCKVRH